MSFRSQEELNQAFIFWAVGALLDSMLLAGLGVLLCWYIAW